MKRLQLPPATQSPSFIGCWQLEPVELCERLIDFFETRQDLHTQGKTAGGLNLESKNSTDLSIRPDDLQGIQASSR